jgi:ribonuclease-3
MLKLLCKNGGHAHGHGTPEYELIKRSGPDHAPQFVWQVKLGVLEPVSASGSSKREAQQEAAKAMLVREGIWDNEDVA